MRFNHILSTSNDFVDPCGSGARGGNTTKLGNNCDWDHHAIALSSAAGADSGA
jgi:hypothetical protein